MKIALVSYEFAGIATAGGIGTYMRNSAQMLARRGHSVEVFTSGNAARSALVESGLTVHIVPSSREEFSRDVVPVFARRRQDFGFDVVEGPEYKADAAGVSAAFSNLPLVVKLHGPSFTIFESNARYFSALAKARYFGGAIRRGRFPNNPWKYVAATDPERAHAATADEIVANSRATAERVAKAWNLPRDRIAPISNVFYPPSALLQLPAHVETRTVLFLGRLEVRKGVIDLARAIPLVLRQEPAVRFLFVGRSLPHPEGGVSLDDYVRKILGKHVRSVEFVGGVPYSGIAKHMEASDICVFPSHWEAAGFVCMEAMAAARGVVGSAAGGMAEIIEHERTGLLVPPRDPKAIAEAILTLLRDPVRRIAMGRAAREHVIAAYSPEVVAPLQEASYRRAIKRAEARCGAKIV